MIEEIRLTPRDGVLGIDVKGNLAATLNAASPGEDWQRQLSMVAGARNDNERTFQMRSRIPLSAIVQRGALRHTQVDCMVPQST